MGALELLGASGLGAAGEAGTEAQPPQLSPLRCDLCVVYILLSAGEAECIDCYKVRQYRR